jgi:hypothetical protein
MPLNPSIALGVRPLEVPNQLAQYSQLAQIQNAQNQNALAQYQLGSAQRAETLQKLTSDAYSQSIDPATGQVNYNTLIGKLAAGGGGSQIPGIEKTRKEIETAALQQQKLKTELATVKTAQFRDQLTNVNSPEAAAQWTVAMYKDPHLSGTVSSVPLEAALAEIPRTPQEFDIWKKQNALGMAKYIEQNKPSVTTQATGGATRLLQTPGLGGAATVVPGSEAPITMSEYQRNQLKNEGQRIGLEGRRVAVLEENQRRDSDPAFQQRMAGAKAVGEAIAKGDVAAQQALPKILTRAEEGMRLIDEMVGKQEVRDAKGKVIQAATKPHPGFENAVGTTWLPGARFVPGTNAADFMSRFDQIKGSSFLEAFESLKGGGSITEKEGAKATDAINRMSTSQSEKEFMAAARDLQEVIRKGVANAQTRASRSGAAAPANAGAVDTNNPLLK